MVKILENAGATLHPNTPTSLGESALLAARAIDSYGLDSQQIFLDEGFELAAIGRPNSRIPTSIMARVWQQAIKLSCDPYVALRVARFFNPAAFSALGTALVASQNIYDALQRATRFSQVICDGYITSLQENTSDVTFLVSLRAGLDAQYYRTGVEVNFCSLFNVLRTVAGDSLQAQAVHFEHTFTGSKKPYEDFFNCPIYFSCQENKLVFDKQYIFEKQLFSNPTLTSALDIWLEEYLSQFNKYSLTTRVKKYFFDYRGYDGINLKETCGELNVSERVLQRKLREEGTSYSQLLNEYRHNLAVKQVNDKQAPLVEVAYILGFSDQSNFTRAFKRWTGLTLHQFRYGPSQEQVPVD